MRRWRSPAVDFPLVSEVLPIVTLVGFLLLLWLFLIRPQARRHRELVHMQSTLEVGDEVMLTSGFYGTIRSLDEEAAQVEIADGVTVKVALGAVGQLFSDDEAATEPAPAEQDEPEVSEEN